MTVFVSHFFRYFSHAVLTKKCYTVRVKITGLEIIWFIGRIFIILKSFSCKDLILWKCFELFIVNKTSKYNLKSVHKKYFTATVKISNDYALFKETKPVNCTAKFSDTAAYLSGRIERIECSCV